MTSTTLQASHLFDISGFVALVTGGGTGIGLMVRRFNTSTLVLREARTYLRLQIARGLASNGARVYITGRRKEVLEQAAQGINDVEGSLVP
jgi:NAD(P)-dependent dehydrogenase (short-subunit alcohol dehydrogenase family)